jgi:hypothetical protein
MYLKINYDIISVIMIQIFAEFILSETCYVTIQNANYILRNPWLTASPIRNVNTF